GMGPLAQPPLDKERTDFGDAEVAPVALALAHDVKQDRPFAVHQLAVDRAPVVLGALEIRIHVGDDFAAGQAALGAATRIRPVLPKRGEARQFRLVNMRLDIEDARADAVLVERTVAQLVELSAGPPAAQQTQRAEAVGDPGDQPGLHPDRCLFKTGLAASSLY